jgi:hypothetical protein
VAIPPAYDQWLQRTERAIQKGACKYVINESRSKDKTKANPYLGLPEPLLLLDYKMARLESVEVSKQHQLLWVLCQFTGLRPASLTSRQRPDGFLDCFKWRDISLRRDPHEATKFSVSLSINIRNKRD